MDMDALALAEQARDDALQSWKGIVASRGSRARRMRARKIWEDAEDDVSWARLMAACDAWHAGVAHERLA